MGLSAALTFSRRPGRCTCMSLRPSGSVNHMEPPGWQLAMVEYCPCTASMATCTATAVFSCSRHTQHGP